MKPTDIGENPSGARRHATMLESVEEIRSLARRSATVREVLPRTDLMPASGARPAPVDATEPYRPVDRPSMALLTVIDDGDDSGEVIRLRASSFVVGRVDGDLKVPHDGGMSGRHAEISRRAEGGQHRWYLRDLQSTNGTFVRASNVILHDGQEVIIGRGRFRFEAAGKLPEPSAEATSGPADATRKWHSVSALDVAALTQPALVELRPEGEGRRFRVTETETWIGRDPSQCALVLNDSTVDPKHARVYRDAKNRWIMENARSLNGLWVRVNEVPLERGGQFQCGEQRFLIKIL